MCRVAILASAVAPIGLNAQTAADLLAQADHLADRGNWFAAGPVYGDAEAAFRKAGDTRNEIYAMFGRLHREVEAGSYRIVRAEVAKALDNPVVETDPLLRIRGLALLGSIDLNTDTAAAKDDWSRVLAIATKIGDQKWENRAKGELGLVDGLEGDIGKAGIALYSAIATSAKLGDVAAHISFATWLANGMAIHGMADRAMPLIDGATKLALRNGYTEVPLQLSIARIRALMEQPDPPRETIVEANRLLSFALAQAQNEHVLGAQSELLNALGQYALRRGDLPAAEKAFTHATEVASAATLPRQEGQAWLHLSQFYRAARQPDKAAAAIDRGIAAIQRVEEAYDLPEYVAEKAEVQSALGSLTEADVSYRRATDLIEGLLVNAPTSQVKSGMIGAMSQIYLAHFRLAWNGLHNGPYAFSIIESARGRTLLDSIRYALQTVPGSTAQSRGEIEIARLQRSLMHDKLTSAQTRHVLDLLDQAYIQLNPVEYARQRKEMGVAHRRPITVATLQRQLRPRESLVEYVLDEKGSYAITINHAGLKIHALPPRSQISQLSRSFVTAIRTGADSRPSARHLYKAIIEPVVALDTSSLIVVPDGPLHLVPFSALVDHKGAYLNSELTLSAAPSASIYGALNKTESSRMARRPFLGVAFSPTELTAGASAPATRGIANLRSGSLTPLRFGKEEIAQAAKVFGPESVILDGAQASEQALKAQPLGEFRVIHLAAHGIGDEREPDRAAIVLLPGSESEDGLWQAREIRRTRLHADVVVLSACETGSGRLQGQEGVMNLARAFLTAGARSVVASLWDVDDRSTATVMESFYQHLKEGSNVNEALQKAQRDFIKEYGDKAKPELWAGFEVIGDGTRRFNFENRTDIHPARSGF